MDNELKNLGIDVFECADGIVTSGVLGLSIKFLKLVNNKIKGIQLPLDWDGKNWHIHYKNERKVLWIIKGEQRICLPQTIIIGPWDNSGDLFKQIKVELLSENFIPKNTNANCLKTYLKKGDFNGKNARLVSYNQEHKTLIFQGANYFDWITTNLSLDYDRSPLPTLRAESSNYGKLDKLNLSPLANITGINGLLFSNDGYMIYQKRNNTVLIRPNELCSGFSGTIDKIDISNLVASSSPLLSNMDTVREAVEEIGIDRDDHVNHIEFLGITRELIRGGTPEIFYAIDLNLPREEILKLIPKDTEGEIHSVELGVHATAKKRNSTQILAEATLWQVLEKIERETKAPISIPFLTNLSLWYWQWNKQKVGFGKISKNDPINNST